MASKLNKAVIGLILSMAGAGAITTQFLSEKEGDKMIAYQDGVGIWTICKGITRIDGKPVTKGMRLSADQCATLNKAEEAKALKWVDDNVKVKLSDPQKAAVASFCYWNIGVTKCKGSTFWRKLNVGDIGGACNEIKKWIFDQGKDCRIKANNCSGQVIRRDQESELLCWGI
jgi:lysozyme